MQDNIGETNIHPISLVIPGTVPGTVPDQMTRTFPSVECTCDTRNCIVTVLSATSAIVFVILIVIIVIVMTRSQKVRNKICCCTACQ